MLMCANVYGDFTNDEKEKNQCQDTICSEVEEGHGDTPWEALYDDVVDLATSQPSKETSRVFPLEENTFPLAFLELTTAGNDISFATYGHYFVSSSDLCYGLSGVSQWSNVRAHWWSNFNLLCGSCTLLPFPSPLTSLCTPDSETVLVTFHSLIFYVTLCCCFLSLSYLAIKCSLALQLQIWERCHSL